MKTIAQRTYSDDPGASSSDLVGAAKRAVAMDGGGSGDSDDDDDDERDGEGSTDLLGEVLGRVENKRQEPVSSPRRLSELSSKLAPLLPISPSGRGPGPGFAPRGAPSHGADDVAARLGALEDKLDALFGLLKTSQAPATLDVVDYRRSECSVMGGKRITFSRRGSTEGERLAPAEPVVAAGTRSAAF